MVDEEKQRSAPVLRQGGLIEKIIEFSAHNKLLIFILTAVAIAGAVWSVQNIPLDGGGKKRFFPVNIL